jgi:hypothetical protein
MGPDLTTMMLPHLWLVAASLLAFTAPSVGELDPRSGRETFEPSIDSAWRIGAGRHHVDRLAARLRTAHVSLCLF